MLSPRDAVDDWLSLHESDLVAIRRDVHSHPELSRGEFRTTRLIVERLTEAGLQPVVLPSGTGVLAAVGPQDAEVVALRADMDALPVTDVKDVSYRSTVAGVCHACGHDVHTVALLGAMLALASVADRLPVQVRGIFQPAEEVMPGGAQDVIAAGGLNDAIRIAALHCDPSLPVGQLGVREGAITAASDAVQIVLTGPGGHTARPHLTVDLISALGEIIVGLPVALNRLLDPRHNVSLVWGHASAGKAQNVIPQRAEVRGTVRTLYTDTWERVPDLIDPLVEALVAPYSARAEVHYLRGVPPVINDADVTKRLEQVGRSVLGPYAVTGTEQSMGGEDFGWYLQEIPGAMCRLGVARADTPLVDLHGGHFDVDERAIIIGSRLLAAFALS